MSPLPRAIIPTLEEMTLPIEERLVSLWHRNAGGVQSWFENFQAFSQCYDISRKVSK